jgi:hypothetical protein
MPTPLTSANLIRDFGAKSPAAALFYQAFAPHDAAENIPRLYYTLVLKRLVAQLLAPDQAVSPHVLSAAWYQRHGLTNFHVEDEALPATSDFSAAWAALEYRMRQYTFDDAPPDALKGLYHHLFAPQQRIQQGEYYTPDWLAEHVLNQLGYDGRATLLDPACGSGTFLVLALRRLLHHYPPEEAITHLAGYDLNQLAVITAQANLLFALGSIQRPLHLPVQQMDTLLPPAQPPEKFDVIAGNPPWMNIELLSAAARRLYEPQWQKYGLFPHKGMAAILGTGKKDLAMLMTYTVADTYLRDGGKLGFILTRSALKSGGAGAGFRRFQIGDTPLRVLGVEDLGALKPFPDVSTPTAILLLEKGQPTHYPIPYTVWRRLPRTRLDTHAALPQTLSQTERILQAAEPVRHDDFTSPWLSAAPDALSALRKIRGTSPYQARAGAYTGGANSVYWLQILEVLPDGLLRVRNIIEGAKRRVPQVTAIIEPDFVFPLLRGRDVRRWCAAPGAQVLMVQDPQRRRGYDVAWLQTNYPLTYTYLAQFETILRQRATFKRYFREDAPFYSMFDIGQYTFAPVKVVWQGMGARRMHAAVVTTQDAKPIITNQAMHPFIPLEDITEAHALAALLNAAPFEFAVLSQTQAGGKSFAQPGILKSLRLPKSESALMQQLAAQSQLAHAAVQQGDKKSLGAIEAHINALAAQAWQFTPDEMDAVQRELDELMR